MARKPHLASPPDVAGALAEAQAALRRLEIVAHRALTMGNGRAYTDDAGASRPAGQGPPPMLSDYPALTELYRDLSRLAAAGAARAASPGPEWSRVRVPWAGEFLLNRAQRAVVAELLEALGSASPEVDQRQLLRSAGSSARRLADVFKGSAAWGRLVVPGGRAGHYRLAPSPQERGPAAAGEEGERDQAQPEEG